MRLTFGGVALSQNAWIDPNGMRFQEKAPHPEKRFAHVSISPYHGSARGVDISVAERLPPIGVEKEDASSDEPAGAESPSDEGEMGITIPADALSNTPAPEKSESPPDTATPRGVYPPPELNMESEA